jgi:hypothetical protein
MSLAKRALFSSSAPTERISILFFAFEENKDSALHVNRRSQRVAAGLGAVHNPVPPAGLQGPDGPSARKYRESEASHAVKDQPRQLFIPTDFSDCDTFASINS